MNHSLCNALLDAIAHDTLFYCFVYMCVCLADNAEQERENRYASLNFLDTEAAVVSFFSNYAKIHITPNLPS